MSGAQRNGDFGAPMPSDAFSVEARENATPLEIDALTPAPLRCRFRPLSTGTFQSRLDVQILWSDGGRTQRSVLVAGRARNLEDVPKPSQVDPARAAVSSDAPDAPAPTAFVDESLAVATMRATSNAAGLADAQRLGVATAEREAASYKEQVPDAPWWVGFAEFAISMGVSGVATIAARHLGQALTGRLKNLTDPKAIQQTKTFIGVVDSMKDGFKNIGKTVTAASMPKAGKPKTPQQSHGDAKFSSNDRINFWTTQQYLLNLVSAQNRELVTHAYGMLEKAPPDEASAGMQTIADGLGVAAGGGAITLAQTLASESQWVAGIARGSLGESTAIAEQGERGTTKLENLQRAEHFGTPDGVLRLKVRVEDLDNISEPNVTSASITGISQEIADRLYDHPLGRVPLPVVLEVTSRQGSRTFTRDEAGRIRVDRDGSEVVRDEPQQIQGATRLFSLVLSKSLSSYGVKRINTNDATGRGDP